MFRKLTLSIVFFISCSRQAPPDAKPTILVSIAPYQALVQRIVGDAFNVEVIVPEGANPHTYEPTPREVQAIAKGSIWFQVGESFEKKLQPVLEEKRKIQCIDLRDSTEMIHGSGCKCDGSGEDRHIWLSPKNLISQVEAIQKSLPSSDSNLSFEENAAALISELKILDEKIKKIVQRAKKKSFIVAHPSFGYFCRDYGLAQISIEFEGKEPTAQSLSHLMDTAIKLQTSVAISMAEHPSKGIEVIAEKLHLKPYRLSAYSKNFLSEMERLALLVADE